MTTDAVLPEMGTDPTRLTWEGVWPGEVVNTRDPLKRGRARVRVPQVYGPASAPAEDKIPDARLPWAWPAFPVAGPDHGSLWVPEDGDPVLVLFWGGDPEHPVYIGGWLGRGEVPARFTSGYDPADNLPKTRLVRTPTGHVLEMRWVQGQEEIIIRTAGGQEVVLTDAEALGGPKIVAQTAAGQQLTLDGLLGLARLQTPAGNVVEALDTGPAVSVVSPGLVTVQGQGINMQSTGSAAMAMTGGGVQTQTFSGAATWAYLSLALSVTLGLTLTALGGVLALVGVGITIFTTGAAVRIGVSGGPFKKLATEDFVNGKFYSHTHLDSMAGVTTPPNNVAADPSDLTQNTEAN